MFGPDLIKESEQKVKLIRDRLKVAQSRQKSYADSKRKETKYEVGDKVYLRVSPLRGVKHFGVKGKLVPRFVGPYKVLERMGEVAYKLELPEGLSRVHEVFHVSQLKKCHAKMADIPLRDTMPLEAIQLKDDLTYEIGDRAYLRVSPLQGVKRFGVKGKLAPRFVGPHRVLERMGEVAYKLELPEGLSGVHDVFHVSQLKKCHADMADIPLRHTMPLEAIQLDSDLTYEEKRVRILEFASRVTRSKVIKFCKVQWSHHTEE